MTRKQSDYSQARAEKAGMAVLEFDAVIHGWRDAQFEIKGFSIRAPRHDGDDYLMTLRALDSDGGAVVAFSGAYDLHELWISAWGRFSNGTLKWKVDDWER